MKKGSTAAAIGCIVLFYIGIIMFVFFPVLHIDKQDNFKAAMIFEVIGFLALLFLCISNVLLTNIKTGYFVPLIMVTAIYTVVRNIITMAFVGIMPSVFFVLLNLILLFLYFVISIPMYMMGRR